jgi:hypothetical protein
MTERDPESFWAQLRKTIEDWTRDDDDRSGDPSLLLPIALTAPILIAVVAMARAM